eukprot:7477684-Alexandrium_andersonii.AAC.1
MLATPRRLSHVQTRVQTQALAHAVMHVLTGALRHCFLTWAILLRACRGRMLSVHTRSPAHPAWL